MGLTPLPQRLDHPAMKIKTCAVISSSFLLLAASSLYFGWHRSSSALALLEDCLVLHAPFLEEKFIFSASPPRVWFLHPRATKRDGSQYVELETYLSRELKLSVVKVISGENAPYYYTSLSDIPPEGAVRSLLTETFYFVDPLVLYPVLAFSETGELMNLNFSEEYILEAKELYSPYREEIQIGIEIHQQDGN